MSGIAASPANQGGRILDIFIQVTAASPPEIFVKALFPSLEMFGITQIKSGASQRESARVFGPAAD